MEKCEPFASSPNGAAADRAVGKLPKMREALGVTVEPTTIAGVKAFWVTPRSRPARNQARVLLHLHGGARVFNPGEAGTREAILMAGLAGFRVLSVDYRMPPDFPYPAALDDAVAVYRELLKTQRPKNMPDAVAMRTYREHQAFYDKLQQDVARHAGKPVIDPDNALAQVAVSGRLSAIANKFDASLILISGCRDNQTSMDGEHNGAFTEQLLKVWNQGTFQGNYANFHARIRARMPATQTPNLFTLGSAGPFLAQEPFTV